MKRKIISNTYLRDIEKYQFKLYLDDDDYYISAKKLIKCSKKFIIKDNLTVMDDGYYVFEVIPKNENYAVRLFLDDKKNPLEYYFDICKNSGLDPLSKIPFYDDLYLDITYLVRDSSINILDEDELLDAHYSGEIPDEELKMIYRVQDKLLDEIKKGTNKVMHIDFNKYLDF